MRPFTVALALAVLAAQSGCGQGVPIWRLPEPPGEQLRRSLGRVAVIVEAYVPARFPSPPLAGACTMAWVGALAGMGMGLAVGLPIMAAAGHCTGGDPVTLFLATCILALGLAVSLAGAALGALIGAIDGSCKGRSAEEVEAGRRILDAAFARAALPSLLRSRVLEELRRETRLAVVEPGQADTLLIIGVPRVFLAGPRSSDPPLTAAGEVSFRLRRSGAKESLHHIILGFRGTTKSFSEWTAANGEEYRLELLRGVSGFAPRVVEEFFLLERGGILKPVLLVLLPLQAACAASYGGLAPVESDDPRELRWLPHRPLQPDEVTKLVYDVRIFEAETGNLVYGRESQVEPVYRLEGPLRPGLHWTVRARYLRRGEPRRTSWTAPEGVDRNGDSGPARLPLGVPLQNWNARPPSK